MGKRETLLDRSQRLLGRALGKASDSESEVKKPPPASGRRDQVLQAQRTHRHRTQQYIRELEKEVIRFHEVESELHARIKHLEGCLLVYRNCMSQHKIQPPAVDAFLMDASSPSAFGDSSGGDAAAAAALFNRDLSPGETILTAASSSSPPALSVHSPAASANNNSNWPAAAAAAAPSPQPPPPPPTISVNLTPVRESFVSMYSNNMLYGDGLHPSLPTMTTTQKYVEHQQQQQQEQQQAMQNGFTNGTSPMFMDPAGVTPTPMPAAHMSTQLAVDFVLNLEHACLAHIRENYKQMHPPRPPSPLLGPQPAPAGGSSGASSPAAAAADVEHHCGPHHLLNAAAPLYYHFKAQAEAATGGGQGQEDLLAAPMTGDSDEIERLLRTSLNLRLGGEVTPVQIWAKVKDMSRRRLVSMEMLDSMVRELGPHVYCNSFGAVVNQSTAEHIVDRIIVNGNPNAAASPNSNALLAEQ